MSGCADVCLSYGEDFEDTFEFYREKSIAARKRHTCTECNRAIEPGDRYERSEGRADGRFWTAATCATCAEVRTAFVCGSFVLGELWQEIRDVMFPIWETSGPIECLAKIESKSTRDELRRRYEEWKNDKAVEIERRACRRSLGEERGSE